MRRSPDTGTLSPDAHGALDSVLICALAMAPALFPAGTPRVAVLACYAVMLVLWVLSMLTRYSFGISGAIRFKAHGVIEMVLAPLLVALPWLAGFAEWPRARAVFVLAGVAVLLLGLTAERLPEREYEIPHEPPIDRGALPPHQGP